MPPTTADFTARPPPMPEQGTTIWSEKIDPHSGHTSAQSNQSNITNISNRPLRDEDNQYAVTYARTRPPPKPEQCMSTALSNFHFTNNEIHTSGTYGPHPEANTTNNSPTTQPSRSVQSSPTENSKPNTSEAKSHQPPTITNPFGLTEIQIKEWSNQAEQFLQNLYPKHSKDVDERRLTKEPSKPNQASDVDDRTKSNQQNML